MKRTCNTCQEEKPLASFYRRDKKNNKFAYKCKSCTKKYNKQYYDGGYKRKQVQASIKQNKQRARQFQEWKKQQSCEVCGENAEECLDLHHRDPEQKEFTISEYIHRRGWNKILEEIEKCVVVCANCHRKIHTGRISI